MKHLTIALLALFSLNTALSAAVALPPKEKLKIYLLMGQSNMAGVAPITDEDKTPHPRVFKFNADGAWEPAVEPLHAKRPTVGPGLAFAKEMVKTNTDIAIGLIPCAVGGSPLKRWERGGDLYEKAVARAKAATAFGELAGILYHQGEADSKFTNTTAAAAALWGDRLQKMIGDIRADLGSPQLPFVMGQIGEFLYTRPDNAYPFAPVINHAIATIPESVPFTACVRSEGLPAMKDQLHFNNEAQHELGRRFAQAMTQLQTILYPLASLSNTVEYPRVDVAPHYAVDPGWPQRPADIHWGQVPGVAIDRDDNIWIYTRTNPIVQVYAPDGRYLFGWRNENTNAIAHGIKIDHAGHVWLVDAGLHTVQKFSRDGKHLMTLGTEGVHGSDTSHFNKPTDVAIAKDGDIFVTDGYNNSRVIHFDKDGKYLNQWGTMGVEAGRFSIPHAIALDSKGRIYVADRNNVRVQVFSQRGKLLDVWRDVVVPWGFFVTAKDEIWVCGSSPMPWRFDPKYPTAPLGCPPKDQVFMKFNTEGKLLQLWTAPKGEDGKERPGELNWLHAVALDSKGNLYAGDIIGKRVQKFVRKN